MILTNIEQILYKIIVNHSQSLYSLIFRYIFFNLEKLSGQTKIFFISKFITAVFIETYFYYKPN